MIRKWDSSVCKNVSILKANISKNNKVYRIVYVFLYCLQKLLEQPIQIVGVFPKSLHSVFPLHEITRDNTYFLINLSIKVHKKVVRFRFHATEITI